MKKNISKNEILQKEFGQRNDLRILKSIRQIIRIVEISSKNLSQQYRITAPQLLCLQTIIANPGATSVAIAREMFLSPSTIVGILDRLEMKGYITRNRTSKDRRKVLIYPTETGKDFSEKAPSLLQEKLINGLEELSDLEQTNIALSLEKVVLILEGQKINASPLLEAGALTNPSLKLTNIEKNIEGEK